MRLPEQKLHQRLRNLTLLELSARFSKGRHHAPKLTKLGRSLRASRPSTVKGEVQDDANY